MLGQKNQKLHIIYNINFGLPSGCPLPHVVAKQIKVDLPENVDNILHRTLQ